MVFVMDSRFWHTLIPEIFIFTTAECRGRIMQRPAGAGSVTLNHFISFQFQAKRRRRMEALCQHNDSSRCAPPVRRTEEMALNETMPRYDDVLLVRIGAYELRKDLCLCGEIENVQSPPSLSFFSSTNPSAAHAPRTAFRMSHLRQYLYFV